MINAILRFVRGTYGVWSELRRLNRNIEWVMASFPDIGLPPSKKAISEAMEEKYEAAVYDEESVAAQAAIDILRRRHRGERIDPNDPGKDWSPL